MRLFVNSKTFYLLVIFSFISFPSEVFSHAGSRRACFDMKGSVNRSSGNWRSDNPVPYWTGDRFSGGGRARVPLRCMHGGVEKHKNNKGSDFCHSHYIYDTDESLKAIADQYTPKGRGQTKKDHLWLDSRSTKKCSKTG